MASQCIEISEFDKYTKNMIDVAKKSMPKKCAKFINKESSKLTARTKLEAKSAVFSHTGKYQGSIKKRSVNKKDGNYSGGSESKDRKAHLLEYGHRQVVNPGKGDGNGRGVIPGKGIGRQVGVVAGRNVFHAAANKFEHTFNNDVGDFLDEVVQEVAK